MRLLRRCTYVNFRRLSTSVRQGFGSFHSEDIEQLIGRNLSKSDVSINITGRVEETVTAWKSMEAIDHHEIKEMFLLDLDTFNFINHGAFGASMYLLMFEAMKWRFHCEKQPLRYFDRELFSELAYALQQMAKFINCPATELMPLQNVTSGLNSIVNSVAPLIRAKDNVVCLSLTYGSTKKILKDLCSRTGASLTIVPLTLPVKSNDQVIELISQYLNADTKLVIIDHITSNTAMILPILDIGAACRQLSPHATVVIDAAHSLMSQHISIYPPSDASASTPSISKVADVWLTNGHKWFSAPKGGAFMWLSPDMKHKIRPTVISHGFHPAEGSKSSIVFSASDKVLSGFSWDGCRDYSSLLTVPSALKIWNNMPSLGKEGGRRGVEGCKVYMRSLLNDAVQLLEREWQLDEDDFAAPVDMRRESPMALVPLPVSVATIPNTRKNVSDVEAFRLQEILHHKYHIEVPVKCLEGRLYVRISAHIYNSIDQYENLAFAVKDIKSLEL